MKILLIADEESKYLWDYYQPGRLADIDLIISCGDLKQEYLEFLVTMSAKPLFYVHGNHDTAYERFPPGGCECIDDQLVNFNGLRIMGLGGCRRYHPGPFQYTDREMYRRIRNLSRPLRRAGGVDIVVTHAPPRGYGDAPDNAHIGFEAFVPLMDKYRPRYLVHGHVHPNYGNHLPQSVTYNDTIVFNAVGRHIIEIEPLQLPPKRRLFHRAK